MNNQVQMIKYINDKRHFTINEMMAEFKIGYMDAVDFIYTYKKSGNIKQLNDFRYHVYRLIPVEEIEIKEEPKKEEKANPVVNSDDDENMSIEEILEEMDKFLEEDKKEDETEKFENKCMDVIMHIIAISPKTTRQEAITKSEEMHDMFKILKDNEMLKVMDRVIEEFKQASDAEFEILKKQFHGDKS